jgi:hypothetical protein
LIIAPPEVVIFDGDPVVRDALEILLQAGGYRTRSLSEPVGCGLDKLLSNSNLLLVAPELSAERWKALLEMISRPGPLAKIPILELLPEGGEQNIRGGHVLLWPCSIDEVKQAIDAILLTEE